MFGLLAVILSILLGAFAGNFIAPTPVAYETYYQISINEEVSLKDFMDKYEIIETRGDMYTVREKGDIKE